MASLDPKLLYRLVNHQLVNAWKENLFVNYPWVMLKEYDYDEETKLKET